VRTYGVVGYAAGDGSRRGRGRWLVRAEPQVMVRLKRVLPRAGQDRAGYLVLADTPELAVDLGWVMARWPLRFEAVRGERGVSAAEAESRMREQAARHRAAGQAAERILAGRPLTLALGEPARQPRPYQQAAADLAVTVRGLLVGDEVGLGKSFVGALVLGAAGGLPGVVVCDTHLPPQWTRELALAWPHLAVHTVTGTRPYDPAEKLRGRQPDVLVVPYPRLAGWADFLVGWAATVVFDEMQELRHGTSTAKGLAAARLADACTYRVGLTASPVYNYGTEMWNLVDILRPDALGSLEEFRREWGDGGLKGMVRDPKALGAYLRAESVLLARTRRDVGREVPEPVLVEQPTEADPAVLAAAESDAAQLARFLLDRANSWAQRGQAARDLDWRLRQATGIAKAPFVAAFVRMLLETEQRVIVFGWHRAVYDLLAEALAEYRPVLYTGSEDERGKERAKQAFAAGHARVLLMSLRSGKGVDGLQDMCSVAVFAELDWSPETHRQAVGRLWRDGQQATVVAYFCLAGDGSDPVLAQYLDIKRMQAEPMVRPDTAGLRPAPPSAERVRALAEQVLRRRAGNSGLGGAA